MAIKSHQKEKIKTATLENDNHVGVISGRSRVAWNEEHSMFSKSNRSDYGAVTNIKNPIGYHEQTQAIDGADKTDPLFGYLRRRCVDFAVNGIEWEVPTPKSSSYWSQLKNKVLKTPSQQDIEQNFWDQWSARINETVPNVLQGLDEINKWMVKNVLLNGMSVPEWEWGNMVIDGVTYTVPLRLTVHNPLSIALERTNQSFVDEKMYLKVTPGNKKISETDHDTPVGLGEQPYAGSGQWQPIIIMGTNSKARKEGFAIKYDWSPADNSALVYGRNIYVGQGLYPTPPFIGLYSTLLMRRALMAADIAILDGVINFILDWEIGDNTKLSNNGKETLPNQPRAAKYDSSNKKIEKSTIEMAKEIITSDTRGNVMQLFHPYYMKLNIKMPDTAVLLNATKYIQSTVEVYQAFGILLSPADKSMNFEGINIQNFEEMLENIRRHLTRFWESLASEIVKRNKDKLTTVPNMIFNPLNTKTESFRQGLFNLMKIGKVSTKSLHQGYNLDNNVEIQRIAQEISSGEKALTDRQVPVSYVQTTQKTAGKNSKNNTDNGETIEEETSITPLQQTGRPKKGSAKEK